MIGHRRRPATNKSGSGQQHLSADLHHGWVFDSAILVKVDRRHIAEGRVQPPLVVDLSMNSPIEASASGAGQRPHQLFTIRVILDRYDALIAPDYRFPADTFVGL
jgi:hypothetical protein